jgi:hypothetical protein
MNQESFPIHRYDFENGKPVQVERTVKIVGGISRDYDQANNIVKHAQDAPQEYRMWPYILHAAVKEIREDSKDHRSLLTTDNKPFDCEEKGRKALCDVGDYYAKLLGEEMVAQPLTIDTLQPVLSKLQTDVPRFMVFTWSTTGNRKVITKYAEKQKTIDYYDPDPKKLIFENKPIEDILSGKGSKYIVYPKRLHEE